MSIEFTIQTIILILGFVVLLIVINRRLSTTSTTTDTALLTWLKTTQQDIRSLQTHLTQTLLHTDKNVTDTLQKSYRELNARLDHTAGIINELKTETGKFSEIGRSMQALHDFLNTPKLRGNLGEHMLVELCAQVLPAHAYTVQHPFSSGVIVDVAIKTHAGIIPVDSKFPMENYSKHLQAATKAEAAGYKKAFIQDVKKHLKTIADKYIQPAEKTVDFALMYVPAEAVYYEITANTPELDDIARDQRVLCVSPSTFYAFLRTILVSFEGQRIQEEAKKILINLRSIHQESQMFNEKLLVLNRHLTNAYNNMNSLTGDFNRLQTKIDLTQQLSHGSSTKIADST
jgi:DNA recombination protein RmuC